MNRIFTQFIMALGMLILLGVSSQAYASHAIGMDLSYECQGGNQYLFTMKLYRDCSGINAPTSVTINLNSDLCPNLTLTLNQGDSSVTEVSPLCPDQIVNSSCNGGALQGVQEYLYTGIYTFLPGEICSDYVIHYNECCRNGIITNITTPDSYSLFIVDSLDNSVCNSSPVFNSIPTPYICSGQLFCYDPGAVDPDGDSLVFSLVAPLEGPFPGTSLAPFYTPGLSATYPINDTRGFIDFDPNTGNFCVIPTGPQACVVVIQVDEYRGGVRVGSARRELQVIVQNCTVNTFSPIGDPDPGLQNTSGVIIVDSNSVQACPGAPIHLEVTAADGNSGDNITISSNVTSALPGATVFQVGLNPAIYFIDWTPTIADTGVHFFSITFTDDGCEFSRANSYSYDVEVIAATDAGPDVGYCPAGGPVELNAGGGAVFTWYEVGTGITPAPGLSNSNIQNPEASPLSNTCYYVISDLPGTCRNQDTVCVNAVADFTLDAGPDKTICKFGADALDGSVADTLGRGPMTFFWDPSGSVSDPSLLNPFAGPLATTMYTLTGITADGCSISDNMTMNVVGIGINVVAPGDATICSDSVELGVSILQPCTITNQPCTGPVDTNQAGNIGGPSSGSFHFGENSGGVSRSGRVQYLYRKTELDSMGFAGGGKISAFWFYYSPVTGPVTSTVTNLVMKVCCTGLSSLGAGPPTQTVPENRWDFISCPDTAAFIPVLPPPASTGTWMRFPINYGGNDGYIWDGTSNLVVEFCSDDLMGGAPGFFSASTTDPDINVLYLYPFTGDGCSQVRGRRTTTRPAMKVEYCRSIPSGLTTVWTPAVGLTDPNIPDPIAFPSTTTTYLVTVDDGSCPGADWVTINVAPAIITDLTFDICTGDSVFAGGAYQTTAGVYVDTYTVAGGCDSIVNSTIMVRSTSASSVFDTICDGEALFVGGAVQTTAGVYLDMFVNAEGCDSTVSTNLEVLPSPVTTILDTILDGDSLFVGGAFQTTAGTYTDVYPAANGCDSTVNTELAVDPITAMDKYPDDVFFQLYPNPTRDRFTLEVRNPRGEELLVEISNVAGARVYRESYNDASAKLEKEFDLSGESSGIYFVKVIMGGRVFTQKMVKQ